jgi:hypothetical protein
VHHNRSWRIAPPHSLKIKAALGLRAPVGANLFARGSRMNVVLAMTLTHISSFRQNLPRQGMPGDWRNLGHKDVDRDHPPWPADSGTPCRNDGKASICV